VRKKISISLSRDLLKPIGQSPVSRSVFGRESLPRRPARLREMNDIRLIEIHADHLNQEAMDVIGYQRLRWLKSS
jgi:hypothetical protein